MFIYTDKDGKFVKVEGDPDHPISQGRLCPRCLAMKDFLESPDRIKYPMKRAKEDRGKDTWERITWDEALDILEAEVKKIWENYGPETIYLFQGTGREATLLVFHVRRIVLRAAYGRRRLPFGRGIPRA